jgi:hypothetical protein
MSGQRPFRILAPDGRLSRDTFFVAAEQPRGITPGCLLVIHGRSGVARMVADAQLFAAEAIRRAPLSSTATTACLAYAMVEAETTDQATPRSVGRPHPVPAVRSLLQMSAAGA